LPPPPRGKVLGAYLGGGVHYLEGGVHHPTIDAATPRGAGREGCRGGTRRRGGRRRRGPGGGGGRGPPPARPAAGAPTTRGRAGDWGPCASLGTGVWGVGAQSRGSNWKQESGMFRDQKNATQHNPPPTPHRGGFKNYFTGPRPRGGGVRASWRGEAWNHGPHGLVVSAQGRVFFTQGASWRIHKIG